MHVYKNNVGVITQHGKPSPPRHQNAIPRCRRRSSRCDVRPLINIAHFTPFSNVRREATWSREECTEMYKSIVFLGFARNCQGQGHQLPAAGSSHTWGPPFRPAPPQNRKLPYHPWKPFIIIVIAHIIIAKKEVSLIAVQLLQNKRKDFEQKWSGIQIKEKPARYFVTLRWENKVWKSS